MRGVEEVVTEQKNKQKTNQTQNRLYFLYKPLSSYSTINEKSNFHTTIVFRGADR